MSPVSNTSSNSGTGSPAAATGSTTPPGTVDKSMFLQLLVAQLKNQDPLNPPDGTQFVAELAQFQQLEQTINTGQDVSAIRSDLETYLGSSANQSAASGATTPH